MKKVFQSADIMLPKEGSDFTKWSVVACDQFTSEPEYWKETEDIVGNSPSTLSMILPEVYLESEDVPDRIRKINQAMKDYMDQGIFEEYKDAMIYLERTDSCGQVRAGIIGKIDLEAYNYEKGSTSLVRATESTVTSRIPPRIKVRENASLELPHIMILIDDADRTVVEPMAECKASMKKVYDFDLMQKGGHSTGYLMTEKEQTRIYEALANLGKKEVFEEKYGLKDAPVLLYAMGDGNHSLATAKAFYERLKAENPNQDLSHHPARYALVEIVNLHSPALEFEAIHRIVWNVPVEDIMQKMSDALGLEEVGSDEANEDLQKFETLIKGERKTYVIHKPSSKLTVGSVQTFLDEYLQENGGNIDYIHGLDVLNALSLWDDSVGFVLPDMGKEELFPTVIVDGALPRKTFSMGHAQDKRYYMETRKIVR